MQIKGKFGALAANITETFRVELIDPVTGEPIRDKTGTTAYVDVLSTDSEVGRDFDAAQRSRMRRAAMRSRTGTPDDIDPLEENQRKLALLTKGWMLIDPASAEVIDVPCTAENAAELYADPGTSWIFKQVWLGAVTDANFMHRSPKR
jgi:hypothetical protein